MPCFYQSKLIAVNIPKSEYISTIKYSFSVMQGSILGFLLGSSPEKPSFKWSQGASLLQLHHPLTTRVSCHHWGNHLIPNA